MRSFDSSSNILELFSDDKITDIEEAVEIYRTKKKYFQEKIEGGERETGVAFVEIEISIPGVYYKEESLLPPFYDLIVGTEPENVG